MKASEEISADLFIKDCIAKGINYRREIVSYAQSQGSDDFASRVDELIREGQSKAYEAEIEVESCDEHGTDMMYDENNKEHYCPICV